MNYIDPQSQHLPKTTWQMLVHLKLTASSNPDGTIKAWLMKALSDFHLSSDLVSRLVASVEETTRRVLSVDSIEGQYEYLEIAVLAPAGQASKGHTWGFFRLERASADSPLDGTKGHCVEYYLYLDQKTQS